MATASKQSATVVYGTPSTPAPGPNSVSSASSVNVPGGPRYPTLMRRDPARAPVAMAIAASSSGREPLLGGTVVDLLDVHAGVIAGMQAGHHAAGPRRVQQRDRPRLLAAHVAVGVVADDPVDAQALADLARGALGQRRRRASSAGGSPHRRPGRRDAGWRADRRGCPSTRPAAAPSAHRADVRTRTHSTMTSTMAMMPGMLAAATPAMAVELIDPTSAEGDRDRVVGGVVGDVLLAGDGGDLDVQQAERTELDRARLRSRDADRRAAGRG